MLFLQNINNIVESCPMSKFGDLIWLHSADNGAATWLQNVAAKEVAE